MVFHLGYLLHSLTVLVLIAVTVLHVLDRMVVNMIVYGRIAVSSILRGSV